jgi:HAMP domain-containing protein
VLFWPLGKGSAKLAVRVYLLGLVQFAIVMVGMFVILTLSQRAPLEFTHTFDFVGRTIAATGGDRQRVVEVVRRARTSLQCALAVYDDQGRLVAQDPETPAPARRSEVRLLAADLATSVAMPDGSHWSVVFLTEPPIAKPPVFWAWVFVILVGVGLFSWFIARSLARPLSRLAAAAHELGSGKVETRVTVERSDELGQVASAFNRMAEQVAEALRAEKELLANVSHELRTPLQRIHIAVELASEGDAAPIRFCCGVYSGDRSTKALSVSDRRTTHFRTTARTRLSPFEPPLESATRLRWTRCVPTWARVCRGSASKRWPSRADSIATAARKHDRPAVMTALGTTLQTCTACHEAFRERVVDQATWSRLTSMPAPTGHHPGG